MGKGHYPPPKPPKPVNPGPVNPNPGPSKPSVPLIWWTENEQGRLTDAEKANIGIATLIIQRDNGTLWRVSEDKPPYTWTQIGKGGDQYTLVDARNHGAAGTVLETIQPWMRVINSQGLTLNLAEMSFGDTFEIVDDRWDFYRDPVTLIPPPDMKFEIIDQKGVGLVLDRVGEGATWRFTVVAGDFVVLDAPRGDFTYGGRG